MLSKVRLSLKQKFPKNKVVTPFKACKARKTIYIYIYIDDVEIVSQVGSYR